MLVELIKEKKLGHNDVNFLLNKQEVFQNKKFRI